MPRTLVLLLALLPAHAATVESVAIQLTPAPLHLQTFDPAGNLILVGDNQCQPSDTGCIPATITKFDPGGRVIWKKNFGVAGSPMMRPMSVALDARGNILLAVSTTNRQLPTVKPLSGVILLESPPEVTMAYQLSPDASEILFSSYLATGTIYLATWSRFWHRRIIRTPEVSRRQYS